MRPRSQIGRATLLAIVLVALLAPSGAGAATVVNGDFESGTLSGWQVYRATGAGNWFAYTGIAPPIGSKRPNPADPVQPPPQGSFAAIADEANPDTLILYQDVTLEAGLSQQLSLLAYYDSYKPIAIPTPDTLAVSEEALRLPNGKFQENQQFRIDVMRPEAPLESVDPADILRTVFKAKPGDPTRMAPRRLTANLSPFAGQTVRIRIATAMTEEVLNAGVDAVSISSGAGGKSPARGSKQRPVLFSFGRARANRRTGVVTLRVSVAGSGLLRASKAPQAPARASAAGSVDRPIEPVTVPIGSARTVTIHLRPTRSARAVLMRKHELRARVGLTYMPTAGGPETASLPVTFKLAPRPQRQR
jgi:hypothetical protein